MYPKWKQVLAHHMTEACGPLYRHYWVMFEDEDCSTQGGTVLGGVVQAGSVAVRVVWTDSRLPPLLYKVGPDYPFTPPTLLLDLKDGTVTKGKAVIPYHSRCIFPNTSPPGSLRLNFHQYHWTAAMNMSTLLLSVMVELQALVEREYSGAALPHELEEQQVQVPFDFYADVE